MDKMSFFRNDRNRMVCDSNKTVLSIIEKCHGVFTFSANQQLFCNFCRVELLPTDPEPKAFNAEVNAHMVSELHTKNVRIFQEKDQRKKQSSLIEALKTEMLDYVSDGYVRCVPCKVNLADSLTLLRNHLVSVDHVFAELGLNEELDKSIKRKSPRLLYLVSQDSDLDFSKEKNITRVICKRCDHTIEAVYNSVRIHLESKKHKNAAPYVDRVVITTVDLNKSQTPDSQSQPVQSVDLEDKSDEIREEFHTPPAPRPKRKYTRRTPEQREAERLRKKYGGSVEVSPKKVRTNPPRSSTSAAMVVTSADMSNSSQIHSQILDESNGHETTQEETVYTDPETGMPYIIIATDYNEHHGIQFDENNKITDQLKTLGDSE